MGEKRRHEMTPARLAALERMRAAAAAKREAEGTEPQREGGRRRHALARTARQEGTRVVGVPPEVHPPAPATTPQPSPPPEEKPRPTLAGDLRKIRRILFS